MPRDLSGEARPPERKATSQPEGTCVTHAAPRGPATPTPHTLLRCLHAQVLPEGAKKKAPKLCPSPAPLSSSGRVHGFLRRAFQMVPGSSSAKLHSLSKCCCSPVLPGRGKRDPRLFSAAARLTSWGEQRAPPTTCPARCWRAPFPLCTPSSFLSGPAQSANVEGGV